MTNTIPPALLSALTTVGLALTHFIWQGALLAALTALLLRLLRKRSPGARYATAVGGLALMAVMPAITLCYLRTQPNALAASANAVSHAVRISSSGTVRLSGSAELTVEASPRSGASPVHAGRPPRHEVHEAELTTNHTGGVGPVYSPSDSATDADGVATDSVIPADSVVPADGVASASNSSGRTTSRWTASNLLSDRRFEQALSFAAMLWALGVLALAARLTVGWMGLYRLRRRGTEPLQADAAWLVNKLCSQLGLSNVRVLATRAWDEPVAFGLWRPVVLMPVSVLTQCPAELIEALIAHELAHIRRHDLWINLFQRIVETILFYHPAVWWVSGRIRSERELCCDDLAVCTTQKRADYAAALVEIARLTRPAAMPALAAGMITPRLSMLDRARRVLRMPSAGVARARTSFWIAGPLSLALAVGIALLAATSTSQTSAASAAATQPSGDTADAATGNLLRPPPESKTYVFDWQDTPLPQVLGDFSEMAGLSIKGLAELRAADVSRRITYQGTRSLAFDEALLLLNDLIEPYLLWMVRRDDYLDLKPIPDFYRSIPTDNMFTSVAEYRAARLPGWQWASVLYVPRQADPTFLATYVMDNTPDAMARAVVVGSQVQSRGIVQYVDRQLEIMERMDTAAPVPAIATELSTTTPPAVDLPPSSAPAERPGSTPLDVSAGSDGRTRYLIRAPGDGVITKIHHGIGSQVQAGDVLAELDNEEIKIDLEAAKVKLHSAQQNWATAIAWERSGRLEAGVKPKSEEALKLAELEMKRLELRLSRTLVIAPATGRLERDRAPRARSADYRHNARVNTGDPLLLLVEEADPASQPEADL